MPLLARFDSGKSTSWKTPANGSVGLARSRVRTSMRPPAPPAWMMARIFTARSSRRCTRAGGRRRARVPGVLLDHVDHDVAHGHGPVAEPHLVVPGHLLGVPVLGGRDLAPPRRPRLLDHGRVGDGTVEVVVTVALEPVEPGHVLSLAAPAGTSCAPPGRDAGPARAATWSTAAPTAAQLLGVEAVALQLQRGAVVAQVAPDGVALPDRLVAGLPRVVGGGHPHVAHLSPSWWSD